MFIRYRHSFLLLWYRQFSRFTLKSSFFFCSLPARHVVVLFTLSSSCFCSVDFDTVILFWSLWPSFGHSLWSWHFVSDHSDRHLAVHSDLVISFPFTLTISSLIFFSVHSDTLIFFLRSQHNFCSIFSLTKKDQQRDILPSTRVQHLIRQKKQYDITRTFTDRHEIPLSCSSSS